MTRLSITKEIMMPISRENKALVAELDRIIDTIARLEAAALAVTQDYPLGAYQEGEAWVVVRKADYDALVAALKEEKEQTA